MNENRKNRGSAMPEEFYSPLDEYEKARKLGQKQYRASVSAGTYPYLPALDDMLPNEDTVSYTHLDCPGSIRGSFCFQASGIK